MAKLITAKSTAISQRPLCTRKRLSCFLERRVPARLAEIPLRKTNNGAQKCVIHRVRNRTGVVVARSVGLGLKAWKKSRVWSSAMISMISPRRISIDSTRYFFTGSVTVANSFWNFWLNRFTSLLPVYNCLKLKRLMQNDRAQLPGCI